MNHHQTSMHYEADRNLHIFMGISRPRASIGILSAPSTCAKAAPSLRGRSTRLPDREAGKLRSDWQVDIQIFFKRSKFGNLGRTYEMNIICDIFLVETLFYLLWGLLYRKIDLVKLPSQLFPSISDHHPSVANAILPVPAGIPQSFLGCVNHLVSTSTSK